MNKDLTHILLIVDRSGSMSSILSDANGGISQLISSQKSAKGKASLTIYEFDNTTEKAVDVADINSCAGYTLVPRGGTALYDAVCTAIDETGRKLSAMSEAERPGLVLVGIVTDGQENSSRQFSFNQMKDRISTQQNIYNWKFTFLCADPTTLSMAKDAQINCSVMYDMAKVKQLYSATSDKFTRMRGMAQTGCALESISNNYTEEEIKAMI